MLEQNGRHDNVTSGDVIVVCTCTWLPEQSEGHPDLRQAAPGSPTEDPCFSITRCGYLGIIF